MSSPVVLSELSAQECAVMFILSNMWSESNLLCSQMFFSWTRIPFALAAAFTPTSFSVSIGRPKRDKSILQTKVLFSVYQTFAKSQTKTNRSLMTSHPSEDWVFNFVTTEHNTKM